MAAIRATENRTESALRKAVHGLGLRFRKYVPGLPGKPDFVFPTERIAVFVDGDYWHARVLREEGSAALERRLKTKNRDYWIRKFHKRVERDDAVTASLESQGWMVLRFWESEVTKDIPAYAGRIAEAVRCRRDKMTTRSRRRA